MSRLSRKLTSVQIVCPHCRRSYEIKVDIKRIYRSRRRAVCSRCGGTFDVVQRMSELGDEPAASSDLSERTTPSTDMRRQQPPDDNSAPIEDPPPRVSPDSPAHPSNIPANDAEQEVSPETEPSEAEESPTDEHESDQATRSDAPPSPPPSPLPDLELPRRHDGRTSDVPHPTSWLDKGTFSSAGELRAPRASDLESPMPWVTGSDSSLAILLPKLPESVIALEQLLTEHSRRSSPGSVGFIPVSPDEALDEASDAVVPTVKTR